MIISLRSRLRRLERRERVDPSATAYHDALRTLAGSVSMPLEVRRPAADAGIDCDPAEMEPEEMEDAL